MSMKNPIESMGNRILHPNSGTSSVYLILLNSYTNNICWKEQLRSSSWYTS